MTIIRSLVRRALTVSVAAAITIASATDAYAAVYFVNTRMAVVAQSTTDGTAHWISSVSSIQSVCNNIMYIPYDDKEMFAVALSAQVNKLNAEIYYETASGPVYFPGYGATSPCRVVSINIKYVP